MPTKVTHVRYGAGQPNAVYIGRAFKQYAASPWGNPFRLNRDGSNRATVLMAYRKYLLGKPELMARLPELRGKLLLCWCASYTIDASDPLICHGQVLAALVDALPVEEAVTHA